MASIYKNTSIFKWVVISGAALIGIGSILYTNLIVAQLKDREQKFIDLFAKTIEYTSNDENSNLTFLEQQIVVPNETIPVILTDALGNPILWRNVDIDPGSIKKLQQRKLRKELKIMKEEHEPIEITFRNEQGEIYDYQYVYYKNSKLLTQLLFYPYVQLSVIAVFGILAYVVFSYSKTAEQNRVWVGLAKETAHQLSTPLSSLMAWLEYFKTDPQIQNKEILHELDKDIKRLETITARFSSIGSVPSRNLENIHDTILNSITYLQKRISNKVKIEVSALPIDIRAQINKPLFDWVIENVCKNAVDAMSGVGVIKIHIKRGKYGDVLIDIKDSGKGISKSKIPEVFQPGYTSKRGGWGLGLTLAKRIIEIYHKGKIFVKHSEVDVGTTFRI
ncbi:MAG: HAMP domain-containing sensor histidine kinase, partial [Bacteroidetes bacterium]|nr:HAMP domain-containing sensor histidine kinase [Bacteroidota bacterium]